MKTEAGYNEVMNFLTNELEEPKLYTKLRAYHEFSGFQRDGNMKPELYVQEFDVNLGRRGEKR